MIENHEGGGSIINHHPDLMSVVIPRACPVSVEDLLVLLQVALLLTPNWVWVNMMSPQESVDEHFNQVN